MTAPVDTVLFDLDDTLCTYRRSVPEMLDVAFEAVGVDPFFAAPDYYERYDRFVDDCSGMRELRATCFASLAEETGYDPDLGRELAAAYADERDHGNVEPLPGAGSAVEALAGDHRLAVVTNGAPEMQGQKLSALPFADAFEHVVHAGYDTPAKPAPDAFHHVLDLLGSDSARTVHVGNSLRSDVAGAQAAGVRAAWLAGEAGQHPGTDEPTPEYVLESLGELTDPPW
ncbi:HAD family hydrolase [Haloarchaeobius amylolyticus]|uniref:HAD family hydrolase n=1 Tax=Haloarchaeobius amylolyticus TaxID=1198296 RepID=UPI0022706A98|nr:HAD family hydrolase [Haloarchaeobius amylolyticus]